MTSATRSGEWVDSGKGKTLDEVGPGQFRTTIPTERYTSTEYAAREREAIWMRVWQIAGRVDELPKAGDWKQYQILDQSFMIARGKDQKLRGFVNACRHRGNMLCNAATGNAKRGFLCQYHLWSYDLEGKLRGVLREDLAGQIDKSENSLLKVSVDTFGGFIFLNPDPDAQPLAEFLGPEVCRPARAVPPRRDGHGHGCPGAIDCNWKVVMDAFEEGYHINGIHPQLLSGARRSIPGPRDTNSSRTTAWPSRRSR